MKFILDTTAHISDEIKIMLDFDADQGARTYDVEFIKTPEILSILERISNSNLEIMTISHSGFSVYITDIPFWSGTDNQPNIVATENADGNLFIPMSNVVCFNPLGSLKKT